MKMWNKIEHPVDRRFCVRNKNVCPDCGEVLERCKALDISDDYIGQPEWAQQQTDARRCVADGCGFYYMRIGPGDFFMKAFVSTETSASTTEESSVTDVMKCFEIVRNKPDDILVVGPETAKAIAEAMAMRSKSMSGDSKQTGFEEKLEDLVNEFSMENGSNTPDYILAQFLAGCLDLFNGTTKARDMWRLVRDCDMCKGERSSEVDSLNEVFLPDDEWKQDLSGFLRGEAFDAVCRSVENRILKAVRTGK